MRRELIGLGILALLSCKNPLEVSDCPDQVQISMSAGITPEIDWTPRCHLYALTVSTYGDANVWSIHGPPQYLICPDDGGSCPSPLNTLYPPIRFGVVPRAAFQDVPPPGQQAPPLNLGWPYAVRLERSLGPATQELFLAIDTFVVASRGLKPRRADTAEVRVIVINTSTMELKR
jgi:hypothetical protein